jgi:NADH dehydrogenase FAD-containing subunit
LHQLATGQRLRTMDLTAYLQGTGAILRVGTVESIDLDSRRVALRSGPSGSTVDYDTLVYALGSTGEMDRVPGVREHAFAFTGPETSRRLHERVSGLRGGKLVVCGGGLTGIETAAEFAESFPELEVELLSAGEIGGWLSPRARRYLTKSFARLKVQTAENARVAEVAADRLVLADGDAVPFSICVWAGGFVVPSLARDCGLKVDGRGRVLTDSTMRSLSHPEVYAIGDAAAVPGPWGDALAMGCRSGGFTGPKVADVIAARMAGKKPREFKYRYIHECISLGRKRALVQFLKKDETPKKSILTGRLGLRYKETTLNGAVVLFRWPGPYLRRRRVRLAPEFRHADAPSPADPSLAPSAVIMKLAAGHADDTPDTASETS